jgi:hypothetical protein
VPGAIPEHPMHDLTGKSPAKLVGWRATGGAWARSQRGRVEDAIVAHATTNALIAAAGLSLGHWEVWAEPRAETGAEAERCCGRHCATGEGPRASRGCARHGRDPEEDNADLTEREGASVMCSP